MVDLDQTLIHTTEQQCQQMSNKVSAAALRVPPGLVPQAGPQQRECRPGRPRGRQSGQQRGRGAGLCALQECLQWGAVQVARAVDEAGCLPA